ncbi:Lipase (class 3) [Musa troglodytarum]|uniref:Lipase (Class 3) n=1 Tax=Musa troglodytarum TaxID=320322 RepID=A0A9E7H0J7_9LILI|nr:Lipase (class 3) [Musa troglodytarum]
MLARADLSPSHTTAPSSRAEQAGRTSATTVNRNLSLASTPPLLSSCCFLPFLRSVRGEENKEKGRNHRRIRGGGDDGVHGSKRARFVSGRGGGDGEGSPPRGMRRSRPRPQLRCSLAVTRAAAPASLKSSRSIGVFPFGSIVTNSIRSFLFEEEEEEEEAGGGMRVEPADDSDEEVVSGLDEEDGIRQEERANWVARISELRRRWRDRQHKHEEDGAEEEDGYCGVSYDTEEEEGGDRDDWDRESFARLLGRVPWSEAKLFSQLAYLCYMAYVIPEIKVTELWEASKLGFVTSSLEKKSQAAIRATHESDPRAAPGSATSTAAQPNHACRQSLAYEIAASAASYIHSRAKGLLSLGSGAGHHDADAAAAASGPYSCGYKNPEVAAYVAASTMTAVVAAEEEARQEAAKDLRSLHSSPCEWFVCDDDSTCTRCFVIQGSDSLASWQANLFFEPTKFEEMEVLVHRGIYEAAKGIYEQFLPEIKEHLSRHGDRARLRFTGHSLGGSLCLLVGLMLLARGDVKLRHLLPSSRSDRRPCSAGGSGSWRSWDWTRGSSAP